MSWFIVDVEADGPYPGDFSMVSFGVVKLSDALDCTYLGKVCPISSSYVQEALAVSNVSRAEHLTYPDPKLEMEKLTSWVLKNSSGRPVFVSDNPAFDYMWMNYYLHKYTGKNVFGHSARRIGDFYSGLVKDVFKSNEWKSLRKTAHTHNPLDDALGNAEALNTLFARYGLKKPK